MIPPICPQPKIIDNSTDAKTSSHLLPTMPPTGLPHGSIRRQLSDSSGSSNPPLTITGVAPWAFHMQAQTQSSHQHQRRVKMASRDLSPCQQHSGQVTSPSTQEIFEKRISPPVPTGFQLVRMYWRRCRVSGSGGDPTSINDDDESNDDENDDIDLPSSWSRDQACLKPKLLPQLRFHDLVFGQVLGEGSFGTVKVTIFILYLSF